MIIGKYVKKNKSKITFWTWKSKKKRNDLVTQYNRTRKTKLIRAKKRKIVVLPKSEKLDEENGEEEQTEEECEVDKVIPRRKKKHTK